MTKLILLATAASALVATSTFAQDADRISDVDTTTQQALASSGLGDGTDSQAALLDVQNEAADLIAQGNDAQRYTSSAFAQGFRGTVSATLNSVASDTTVDSDTKIDAAVGANMSYGAGPWNQSATVSFAYAENQGGEKTKDELYATYDVSRDFTSRLYGFGTLRGTHKLNSYAVDSADANYNADYAGASETSVDYYAGVGVGFRIFNEPTKAWRVQAGPGYRIQDDGYDSREEESAGLISSKFYYAFNDALAFTNDTDVLWSESNTTTVSEFGLNYAMNGPLSLRLSTRGQHDTDSLENAVTDFKDATSWTTGLALVYALN